MSPDTFNAFFRGIGLTLSQMSPLSVPPSSTQSQQSMKQLPNVLQNQATSFVHDMITFPWPAFGILAFFSWLAGHLISRIVTKIINSSFVSKGLKISITVENMFRRAAVWFTGGLVLWLGLNGILTVSETSSIRYLLFAYTIGTGTWFIVAIWDIVLDLLYKKTEQTSREVKLVILPLVGKIIKVIIVAAGVFLIISPLGWGISLVAGVSGAAGGLAIGLGGKNMTEDLFGSIGILMDMPYGVGDWVAIGEVQGFVEQINMRSTKIRSLDDSLVTLSNGKIATTPTYNYGLRRYQLIQTTFYVPSTVTSEILTSFCNDVRDFITNYPLVKKDLSNRINMTHVSFYDMNLLGFQIQIVTQLDTDFLTSFTEREKIMLQIVKFAEKYHIQIIGAE